MGNGGGGEFDNARKALSHRRGEEERLPVIQWNPVEDGEGQSFCDCSSGVAGGDRKRARRVSREDNQRAQIYLTAR